MTGRLGISLNGYEVTVEHLGWHISDLKIYDTSKDIREFGLKRAPQSWCYVRRID